MGSSTRWDLWGPGGCCEPTLNEACQALSPDAVVQCFSTLLHPDAVCTAWEGTRVTGSSSLGNAALLQKGNAAGTSATWSSVAKVKATFAWRRRPPPCATLLQVGWTATHTWAVPVQTIFNQDVLVDLAADLANASAVLEPTESEVETQPLPY